MKPKGTKIASKGGKVRKVKGWIEIHNSIKGLINIVLKEPSLYRRTEETLKFDFSIYPCIITYKESLKAK